MSREIEQNPALWCDAFYNNVIDHIQRAKEEALNHSIEANAIIVKDDFAITQGFYEPTNNAVVQPMICGLKVFYQKNKLPFDANFVVLHANVAMSQIEALEKENSDLRQKLQQIKDLLGVNIE